MDWFGIALIIIPVLGLLTMALDVYLELHKRPTNHRQPPRRLRATYGPGYHPVLSWNWDEAYDGMPGSQNRRTT